MMPQDLADKLKNFTVLYLEDDEGVLNRVVNTLKFYFDEVYPVSKVDDALEVFNNNHIDLILCDIKIEGDNQTGVDFVKAVRTKDIEIPIIMMTAYTSEKYLLELISLKIDYYVKKPVNTDKLFTAIFVAMKNKLSHIKTLGDELTFDIVSQMVCYRHQEVKLTKKEKQFVMMLLTNLPSITTYEQIAYELWGDSIMSEAALKSFIKEFRKKMPSLNLQNISKEGYKIIL